MRFLSVILVLLSSFYVLFSEGQQVPPREIPGIRKPETEIRQTVDGQQFFRYDKIPYAQIQGNELFQPAIPITSTEVVLNEKLVPCPGLYPNTNDKLDYNNCLLVLKIEAKDISGRKPVIVHFPVYDLNQGFTREHDSPHLLTKDLVLVEVRHRVGPYGFLSTSTEKIPGNMGIRDIIEALKWIQKYISYFGGDPNRVTLNGQYKTAGIVQGLVHMSLAEGLFHRVIYQSGSVRSLTGMNVLETARSVAAEMNCTALTEIESLNHCLVQTPAKVLMEAYNTIWEKHNGKLELVDINSPNSIVNDGYKPHAYPVLGGFVDHPSIDLILPSLQPFIDGISVEKFPAGQEYYIFRRELDKILETKPNYTAEISQEILSTVFEKTLPLFIDTLQAEIKLEILSALLRNGENGGNSYMYIFRFKDGHHYLNRSNFNILTNYVDLLDDYPYLYSEEKLEGTAKEISDLMVDIWASFAETGFPHSSKMEPWRPMDSPFGPYIVIDKHTGYKFDLDTDVQPTSTCVKNGDCKLIGLEDLQKSHSGKNILK